MCDLQRWGLSGHKCADMALSYEDAKQQFLAIHGTEYGYNGWVEQKWWEEVGQRLGRNVHYLDMTGAGLYTNSQITAVLQELTSHTFGNPHSRNPSSSRSTREVETARQLVLQFFNADPEEYHVVFTKGATESLKMVGEYFPWAFNNNSNNLLRTSACVDTDSNTSSITRTISSASSMSTSSYGSSAHAAGTGSGSSSHFIYTQANHKSVLGIGAYAKQHGAHLHCLSLEDMQQWLDSPCSTTPQQHHHHAAFKASSCVNGLCCAGGSPTHHAAVQPGAGSCCGAPVPPHTPTAAEAAAAAGVSGAAASSCCGSGVTHHLVAYPAKDNYEGRIYPLQWIEQVHAKSDAANKFFVTLDVAAHAASHVLDLSEVKPDFVTMSFYKIFGYPSGLGALLVHKDAARHLRKVYFGGGSVDYCTAEDAWAVMSAPPAGLEDGTLGFLNIAALKHGFNMLRQLGGMQAIERHVEALRSWTYQQLAGLHHSNGAPLLTMFGAHEAGPHHQGGIFQFQVLTCSGDRLPGRLVEAAATAAGLHLRTGCNCNPGRCLPNLGITPEEERARAAEGHTGPVLVVLRPRPVATATSKAHGHDDAADDHQHHLVPVPLPVGSVRASLGALSTFEDCYALVRFLATTFTDFEVNDQDLLMGVKMVSVLTQTEGPGEHEVTVCTKISTSDGGAASAPAPAPAGDLPHLHQHHFPRAQGTKRDVSEGGASDSSGLLSISSEDSVLAEGIKAVVCSQW